MKENYFLVTGASSGIGRALTLKLASEGENLILVSRDKERLEQVRAECLALKPNSDVIVLPCDLSQRGAGHSLAQKIEGRKLKGLILNAGFGLHGNFLEAQLKDHLAMVDLQVASTIELTHCLLPKMEQSQPHYLLVVGSVYCYAPVPGQSIYGASKAFMASFIEALAFEMRETRIHISLLCPGTTRTEFRKRAQIHEKSPKSGMSPESVAEVAIRGLRQGQRVIVPGRFNGLFVNVMRHLPGRLATRLMFFINNRRGVNQH